MREARDHLEPRLNWQISGTAVWLLCAGCSIGPQVPAALACSEGRNCSRYTQGKLIRHTVFLDATRCLWIFDEVLRCLSHTVAHAISVDSRHEYTFGFRIARQTHLFPNMNISASNSRCGGINLPLKLVSAIVIVSFIFTSHKCAFRGRYREFLAIEMKWEYRKVDREFMRGRKI